MFVILSQNHSFRAVPDISVWIWPLYVSLALGSTDYPRALPQTFPHHVQSLSRMESDWGGMWMRNWEVREFIQKFPDWPPGARTANDTALCHKMQLYRSFVSQSTEFCRHNLLCCFSMSVLFISLSTQSENFWIQPCMKLSSSGCNLTYTQTTT